MMNPFKAIARRKHYRRAREEIRGIKMQIGRIENIAEKMTDPLQPFLYSEAERNRALNPLMSYRNRVMRDDKNITNYIPRHLFASYFCALNNLDEAVELAESYIQE